MPSNSPATMAIKDPRCTVDMPQCHCQPTSSAASWLPMKPMNRPLPDHGAYFLYHGQCYQAKRHTSIHANKNDLLDIAVGFDAATTECLGSGIYYVLSVEVFLLLGYVIYYQGLHHGTMCAPKRYPVTMTTRLLCSHVWNPCNAKWNSKNDTGIYL